MRRLLLFWWFLAATALVWAADWKNAAPDYPWSFPADHWAHREYRTEWWYFTGHLAARDDPERSFGYQFTLFRIGLLTERPDFDSDWTTDSLIMGHAAVTDPERRQHRFSELLYRETPFLGQLGTFPDPLVAWVRGPVGTSERWTLRWNGRAFDFAMADERLGIGFELATEPLKDLVLQGPNGFSRKGDEPGAASLYYSFTRLATEGTLSVDGESLEVRGESWMDKEFSSSQLGEDQQGWDWFSLQLDDRRELMIYILRAEDGSPDFRHATLVSSDGQKRYLDADEWSAVATDTWRSPSTGATYPSRWTIAVPAEAISIDVRPLLSDQENRSQLPGGVYYWEGAVDLFDASGARLGRGYVELTGYGENSRPPV
ncbi:MAG TPA: lipocalin-like domain-containing protein [Vicinamibacteria bacterium]